MAKKTDAPVIADVDAPIGDAVVDTPVPAVKRIGVKVTTSAGIERWFFPDEHYTTEWQIYNEIINARGAFLALTSGLAIGLGTIAFVEIAEEA